MKATFPVSHKIKTIDMEIAVIQWCNPRLNIVVPNVSWGLGVHECDILSLTPQGYASEIEIKVCKYDLRKDKEKMHRHKSNKLKYLWFAIPEYLESEIEHIPEQAGIIIVKGGDLPFVSHRLREAKQNSTAKPLTDKERLKIAHLGAMRISGLKRKISKLDRTLF